MHNRRRGLRRRGRGYPGGRRGKRRTFGNGGLFLRRGDRGRKTLEKGGVTSVLRKLSAAAGDDSFRIRTKAAIAGVRGTSFCVWSDGVVSYICACNGTIRTIDAQGSNELILSATHHSARLYTPEGRIIAVREAGMEHHTDESVESLAARIGERIDWTVLN